MKRIISLVLTLAILLSCAPTIVVTKAATVQETETQNAPTTLYTVTDMGVEGAVVVESLEEAFSKIEAKNKQWKADDSVEIRITGTAHTGGHENGLLFGLTTIWREDGTKLPITIRGVDDNKDAYIYLDAVGGWYACANDYTFINLTLPIGDQETQFYAGSGNITFIDVLFNKRGDGIDSIEEQTDRYEVYKYVAQTVTNDAQNLITPDVSILPIGDAWQLARERDRDIGEGLMGMYGTQFGDAKHDGDTGGGQYLNACIYYEVMTGLSCVGNTWRPDYDLSEDKLLFLQQVAHDAVKAIYGEDHYKDSWTDIVGNDNELNILILGSSNCAYLTDELHALCEAAGIKSRVYHAYYSGVPITTQWNWIQNDNGDYLLHTFENGKKVDIQNQKITDFLMDHKWDTITIYQSTNVISKYANDEEGLAKAYATCQYADDFYNYMYNYENGAHQDAKYYWYQVAAGPVGATSMKSATAGSIYADNCTQAVYAGWDELEPGEKVQSSITFCGNSVYRNTEAGTVAAVGYMTDAPETPYTDATAQEVKYMEASGYDNIADIRPADVESSIIIDGEYAYVYKVLAKYGYAPSAGSVILKQGTAPYIYGAQAPTGSTAPYYGDIALEYYSGTLDSWRGIYGNVTGDVTIVVDGATITNYMITVQAGYTVDGDMLFDIRDGRIEGRIYTAGNGNTDNPAKYSAVTGTVTFRWGGGYIKEIMHGRRSVIGNFVNELYVNPDAEIPASTDKTFSLGGIDSCTIQGEVRNTLIGAVPASITGKIANFGNSTNVVSKIVNTVKADEAGNAPTFTAFNGGKATQIVNNIEAGTFGGFVPGTADTVTTTVSGGTFAMDPSAYVAEGHTAVMNADGTYTVENHNFVLVNSNPATCVSGGEMRYECSDCDEVKVVTLEQDPNAHDWDMTDPENMVCKNGCGKTTNIYSPFEYQSEIYCEHCKETLDKSFWTPITLEDFGCEAQLNTATTFTVTGGHYYLKEDIIAYVAQTTALMNVNGSEATCLHLNGKSLWSVKDEADLNASGSNTGSNASVGASGSGSAIFAQDGILNLMGNGYVAGRENTNTYGTITISGNASVNVYGGTYNNHRKDRACIFVRNTGGRLNIYDGVFQDPVGIISGGSTAAVITINGGTFVGNYIARSNGAAGVAEGSSITITGGVFTPSTGIYTNTDTVSVVPPVISGGAFSIDPTACLASGYKAAKDGDVWTIVKAPNTPVFGTFDPAGCDGWAYCEACYKQALAAGQSDAEAKAAALVYWIVYDETMDQANTYLSGFKTYYTNVYGSADILENQHPHIYLTNHFVADGTRFLGAIGSDLTVCLNLNGCNVTMNQGSSVEELFRVSDGATLNIVDTVGTSVVTGISCGGIARGTTLFVRKGTMNIYGGTYRTTNSGFPVASIQNGSTLNLYGGVIDGRLYDKTDLTKLAENQNASRSGMAVTIWGDSASAVSTFNMYDGTIYGGTLKSAVTNYEGAAAVQVGFTNSSYDKGYGAFNMYNGTIYGGTNNDTNSGSSYPGLNSGAVSVHANATMTMSGGTIQSGTAKHVGGVAVAGVFKMSGGHIYGGEAEDGYDNVCASKGGKVILSGNAKVTGDGVKYSAVMVSGTGDNASTLVLKDNATVESAADGSFNVGALGVSHDRTATCSTIVVDPSWTGSAAAHLYRYYQKADETWETTGHVNGDTIELATVTLGTYNEETGAITPGNVINGNLYAINSTRPVKVNTTTGALYIPAFSVETEDGTVWYDSFTDAAEEGAVGLWADTDLEVSGDTYVTAQKNVTVRVSGSGKLYAMDAAHDDYSATAASWIVEDGVEIVRDVTDPTTGNRYLNITTEKGEGEQTIKSYRVDLQLTSVTLRAAIEDKADQMGLYYKANIYMSTALAKIVDTYGLVLSLADMPTADFKNDLNDQGKNENGYTQIQETLGVSSANDYTVSVNSGAVFGIMKTDLDPATNSARGKLPIYANVYLAIDADGDGTVEYYMADTNAEAEDDVSWSLYDVMTTINNNWDKFTAAHSKVTAFYSYWSQYGMNEWEAVLPKIAG